jgi:hypothetical protein
MAFCDGNLFFFFVLSPVARTRPASCFSLLLEALDGRTGGNGIVADRTRDGRMCVLYVHLIQYFYVLYYVWT